MNLIEISPVVIEIRRRDRKWRRVSGSCNAPIIVNPHRGPTPGWAMGACMEICSDLLAYFVPRVGAFVQEFSLFWNPYGICNGIKLSPGVGNLSNDS